MRFRKGDKVKVARVDLERLDVIRDTVGSEGTVVEIFPDRTRYFGGSGWVPNQLAYLVHLRNGKLRYPAMYWEDNLEPAEDDIPL